MSTTFLVETELLKFVVLQAQFRPNIHSETKLLENIAGPLKPAEATQLIKSLVAERNLCMNAESLGKGPRF